MNLPNFINKWLAAWTGNNVALLLEFYSDDCFYSDPARRDGVIGKQNLKKYFAKLLGENPDWKWTAIEIIPTAKGCTLKWKAEIPLKDCIIYETGLDILEICDGKISRNEVWFDRVQWYINNSK